MGFNPSEMQNKKKPQQGAFFNISFHCTPERGRTSSLRNRKPMLYPVELRAQVLTDYKTTSFFGENQTIKNNIHFYSLTARQLTRTLATNSHDNEVIHSSLINSFCYGKHRKRP